MVARRAESRTIARRLCLQHRRRSAFSRSAFAPPNRMVCMDYRVPWIMGRSSGVILDIIKRRCPPPIIYECHIGTFTPAGTFDAAAERLEYLRDLGVTHVELMPVAEFSGVRGWGYDGVNLYAPHRSYGGPDAMKRFVDASHEHGLGVILDVVYNHLGRREIISQNSVRTLRTYIARRGATRLISTTRTATRSGDFFCDNALMWLRDYRVDGLRIDAVHAIFDALCRFIFSSNWAPRSASWRPRSVVTLS